MLQRSPSAFLSLPHGSVRALLTESSLVLARFSHQLPKNHHQNDAVYGTPIPVPTTLLKLHRRTPSDIFPKSYWHPRPMKPPNRPSCDRLDPQSWTPLHHRILLIGDRSALHARTTVISCYPSMLIFSDRFGAIWHNPPHAICTALPWTILFPCFCLSDRHCI